MADHTGEILGGVKVKHTRCDTCVNAHGKAPWADRPGKAYCLAYTRESGYQKPAGVYFNGADCPFYVKEEV